MFVFQYFQSDWRNQTETFTGVDREIDRGGGVSRVLDTTDFITFSSPYLIREFSAINKRNF